MPSNVFLLAGCEFYATSVKKLAVALESLGAHCSGDQFCIAPSLARDGIRVSYIKRDSLEVVAAQLESLGWWVTVDQSVNEIRLRCPTG